MQTIDVVEFLWGSPIITGISDEDWLIFVNNIPQPSIRCIPALAGQRNRRVDPSVQAIKDLPDFLYDKPFYNVLCLFCKEYFVDETADPQVEKIVSMREDIARMNMPEFYNTIFWWLNKMGAILDSHYSSKRCHKLILNYALVDGLISSNSFEQSLGYAIEVAKPIKLENVPKSSALETLEYYRDRFNRPEVRDFFVRDPNRQTYLKVKHIVDSIDLQSLSGNPVRRLL